jgi:hypothetical protein
MRRPGKMSIPSPVYSRAETALGTQGACLRPSLPLPILGFWTGLDTRFLLCFNRTGFPYAICIGCRQDVPEGSDCTRRPSPGLCSLTGLEAVLLRLHPFLFTANSTKS